MARRSTQARLHLQARPAFPLPPPPPLPRRDAVLDAPPLSLLLHVVAVLRHYRFLAAGSLEEKVYQRQLSKEGLQTRVVDEKAEVNSLSSEELG